MQIYICIHAHAYTCTHAYVKNTCLSTQMPSYDQTDRIHNCSITNWSGMYVIKSSIPFTGLKVKLETNVD